MPDPQHPAAWLPEQLLADVDEKRFKSSGPGGQHRNKVETAVRLTHRPTGITGTAAERRSQGQNREMALLRLRGALALELRMPLAPEGYTPSATWLRRTSKPGLSVNPRHQDVPALLAEALDMLAALNDDMAAAAQALSVSTSRLVKVLKLDPAALTAVNSRLKAAGRSTWR